MTDKNCIEHLTQFVPEFRNWLKNFENPSIHIQFYLLSRFVLTKIEQEPEYVTPLMREVDSIVLENEEVEISNQLRTTFLEPLMNAVLNGQITPQQLANILEPFSKTICERWARDLEGTQYALPRRMN